MVTDQGSDVPIVITGPGGWIGSAMLAHLAATGGPGWDSRVRLFGSADRLLTAPDGTVLPVQTLDRLDGAAIDGAMVIHLAYLTKEKAETLGRATFMATNLAIDGVLADALGSGRPHGIFVASSGAAALAEDKRDRHIYGMAKVLQEDTFLRLGQTTGVPVLAGRIFNIAGPYINKFESYAVSSFLTQALRDQTITIAARTPVYRSYLHVMDLCRLVLACLEAGAVATQAVDLCGDLVLEMEDVARGVAREVGLDFASIHRGPVDCTTPSLYLGKPTDTKTLAMRVGVPLRTFESQVHDTAKYIRSVQDRPNVG